MKCILNLNHHTEEELKDSIVLFFKANQMTTEEVRMEDGTCVIHAVHACSDFTDKMFGEEMKCRVEIRNLGDGTVEMTAGKGDWNGKAVGAAVIAGCIALVPFCWPVALAAGTSAAVVVKNTVCQAKLPEDVCHYAAAFLS